jgi:hypothetical protein
MRKLKLTHLLAAVLLVTTLLSTGCLGFGSGGLLGSTDFLLRFRDSSSFPDLDPVNNVLLVDVSNNVDNISPAPTLKESIDGTQVHTQTVTQGGRIELPFPPTEWTPSVGEHEVEVTIGDVTHSLPFTWHD